MQSALTLAAEHDLAGRHDDAINALARATQAGDLEAMTELGKRLVIGDRGPLLPKDGTGFLIDAFKGGHAEAALKLATLTALGAHVEQSWHGALALLVFAAQRGSESARGQLRALAGTAAAADVGAGEQQWLRLAQRIDHDYWMSAPAGQTLCADPLVRVYRDFVPDSVCEWLIERARPNLKRALIYDPVGGKDVADHMRTNSAAGFDLMHADLVQVAVQCRMSAAVGVSVHQMEGPTVLHYAKGEQITNHYDFVNPRIPNYDAEIKQRGQRIITFLVYLNDDYDGGETTFPELGIVHRGTAGDGLYFINAHADLTPNRRMLHTGSPPLRGEKWVVSQFIVSKRLRP